MLRTFLELFIALVVGINTAVAMPSATSGKNDLAFPDIEVHPSELGATHLRIGQEFSSQSLSDVMPGKSMEEVINLLGEPRQKKTSGDIQSWDYVVSFPVANGTDSILCQYKVIIDPDGTVSSTRWRRHTCEIAYQSSIEATLPPEAVVETITLSADVLFAFGEHELSTEGRRRLKSVVEQIADNYQNPVITLVGHTDRIGSSDYNMRLSLKRAESVRTHLFTLGVPLNSMVAKGRGKTEPIVFCPEKTGKVLEDCLRPNRRVDIEVYERTEQSEAL